MQRLIHKGILIAPALVKHARRVLAWHVEDLRNALAASISATIDVSNSESCGESDCSSDYGFYTRPPISKRNSRHTISQPRHWIQEPICGILKTCRPGRDFDTEDSGAHFHAQAHISAQPPQAGQDTRLPGPHEDQERSRRAQPPPRAGPQARIGQRWLPRLAH